MGIPVKRQRRYTICIRKDTLVFGIPWSITTMQDNFWRSLDIAHRVFFRAPKSYLKLVFDHMAKARSVASGSPLRLLLAPGARKRLAEHEACLKSSALHFGCINISQNASFYGQAGAVVPSLTKHSAQIWGVDLSVAADSGLIVNRLLVAYEKLGVHGWPILLPAQHDLSKLLPGCFAFRNMLTNKCPFKESELNVFTGNGMHIAQVGLALSFCLCGVAPANARSSAVGEAGKRRYAKSAA